jgi:hypothetical protein
VEVMKMYQITKVFTGGILKGLTIQEKTSVKFAVGFECKKPIGGSSYKITECIPV